MIGVWPATVGLAGLGLRKDGYLDGRGVKGCRCKGASFIPVSLVLSMGGLPVGAGQTVLYLELGRCNRESLELGFSQTLEFQISLL